MQLDKTQDAHRLRGLVAVRNQAGIVQLLEQNAHPAHMYALHRAYGSMLVPDVLGVVTEGAYRARARVYLGEQLPLDARITSRGEGDAEAILADLERVPDARVLDLFIGDAVPLPWTVVAPSTSAEPAVTPVAATTTLTAVKDALRERLSDDDYDRAMRVLLGKAERAMAVRAAQPDAPHLEGFTFTIDDLADPANPGAVSPLALSPVMKARVDHVEARIRQVDGSGSWWKDPRRAAQAYVALAELGRVERRALAIRLHDHPLENALGGISLGREALEADDAAVVRDAILVAEELAALQGQALRGEGLDAALARAGELVHAARARLAQLPADARPTEHTQAQAEVDRLEAMFFGPGSETLGRLRRDALQTTAGDGGIALHESRLRRMGADAPTIATEQLVAVPTGDATGLIVALRKIGPEHRLLAMQRSGQLDAHSQASMRITADQRELLSALLWQGSTPLSLDARPDPNGASPRAQGSGAPIIAPPGLGPSFGGPPPEIVIALHDLLDAMGRGAAHEVLARLARMSDAEQRAIYADPRYRAKLDALPEGTDRSPERDFKDSLQNAERIGPRQALLRYPGPGGDGDVYQKVLLESIGARVDQGGGQASMRRAYVLVERLGGRAKLASDPALLATLGPEDRRHVELLVGVGNLGLLGERDERIDQSSDQETASQIILGQPQLTDTAEAALDPTLEAEFMYYRLRRAAGVREGNALMDSFSDAGPEVDEAVTEFMVLYRRVKPGGIDRGELAELADLYHRAMRRLDRYRKANDSFASSAAQVVGAVVATVVVTIASAGTLGPVAVGALAGLSGAAASAATGAAIRLENTTLSVLKDAGTGAIEGIAAAAGASLAARIVRGTTAGMTAGRAATTAGAHAAGHATGGLGVTVAEAAIDGALGGAAGDLFQTATDEATWDRGISEAFAALLASIARGAATGGVGGGVLGGAVGGVARLSRLSARVGDAAARDVGRLLDDAGVGTHVLDQLTDRAEDQLVHAAQLIGEGKIAEAEAVLNAIDGMPGQSRAVLAQAARSRVLMSTVGDIGPVEIEGMLVQPREVSDREFRRLAGAQRGDAVVLIENGRPQVVIRKGAPASALREELTHVAQWNTDPAMRLRMQRLSEEQLGSWHQLSAAEKLERHLDKLEIEADAQRRILDQLADRAAEDPEAAMRMLDAEETLFELGQRIDQLRAVRGHARLDVPTLGIEEAPRLFARGAQTPTQLTGQRARRAALLLGKSVHDPAVQKELGKLGYVLARRQDTGRPFRLSRKPARARDLPHLSIDEEAGLIREPKPRPSFPEQKEDAARQWRRTSEDLDALNARADAGGEGSAEARRALADAGPRLRAALAERVTQGTLDEGSAGLVVRWAKVIDELDQRGLVGMPDLLAQLPHASLTDDAYEAFRRMIRRRTVEALMAIEDAEQRATTLHAMLAVQPDNQSKGHLFTEFRRELMRTTMHEGRPVYATDGRQPPQFEGPDLKYSRRPDDVVHIQEDVESMLPRGRYAIEDKTGDNAFRLAQAEDYARRSDPNLLRRDDGDLDVGGRAGGFKLTREGTFSEYDGLVYVFSGETEGISALERMEKSSAVASLVGRHPGGIHVMILGGDGKLRVLTKLIRNPRR